MEKHLISFNKLVFRTTLIYLLLHAILSHYQIVFESMKNVHADNNIAVKFLKFGDTRHVWENQWWLLSIDYFKRSHVSGNMIKGFVPPFDEG
jgi:hypothetical protein